MKSFLGRFLKNRRGAFAMQFALMVVPLFICTGLAIDGGRAFLARYELGSALDAAALAVGSTTSTDPTVLNSVARKYVDLNYHQSTPGSVVLTLTPTTDVVTLTGNVQMNTFFMPLVGIPQVKVAAVSEVRRGGSNLEVSLILDTTGSMGSIPAAGGNPKITDLIQAAKDLVDTVVSDVQSPYYSKVALVPYSMGVNVGTYADAVRGAPVAPKPISIVDWRGPQQAVTFAGWKFGAAKMPTLVDWKNGTAKSISAAAWKNGATKSITAATKASQIVITSSAHGFANGSFVRITGVTGMTQLNNTAAAGNIAYLVSDVTANTFMLKNTSTLAYINSSAWSTFSAGSNALQLCYDASCDVRVTTTAAHGYANGDFIHISGVTGMTTLNNSSPATWTISVASGSTFIVPLSMPATTFGGSAIAQKCWDVACTIYVASNNHGFTNGDFVRISGVAGFVYANNSSPVTWAVANATTAGFFLSGQTTLPAQTYSSGGTLQKCYDSSCDVGVTAAANGFSTGQKVWIGGVNGFTAANSAAGSTWTITTYNSDNFILNGQNGMSASVYSGGGNVAPCADAACEVQVTTTAAHGLAANSLVVISGVTGMTTANNTGSTTWTVASPTGSTFFLSGTNGPSIFGTTLGTGGSVNCLTYGCPFFKFTNPSGSSKTFALSTCVTERTGADKLTDASPDIAPVGSNYASPANPCLPNQILPMTADKTAIKNQIGTLVAQGSTSGQVGSAWGWYMLSPNFGYLWPNAVNRPAAYNTAHLVKVAVLMTDGDFNSPYCKGVIASDAVSGSGSTSDHINCTATNGDAYTQTQAICDKMKSEKIVIYTVGFDIVNQTSAVNLMQNCATDSAHAFIANSGTDLKSAFKSIAKSISLLRLSK